MKDEDIETLDRWIEWHEGRRSEPPTDVSVIAALVRSALEFQNMRESIRQMAESRGLS